MEILYCKLNLHTDGDCVISRSYLILKATYYVKNGVYSRKHIFILISMVGKKPIMRWF